MTNDWIRSNWLFIVLSCFASYIGIALLFLEQLIDESNIRNGIQEANLEALKALNIATIVAISCAVPLAVGLNAIGRRKSYSMPHWSYVLLAMISVAAIYGYVPSPAS